MSGYNSTLRNNVRSRAWGAAIGCSYRVERCCIVKVVSVHFHVCLCALSLSLCYILLTYLHVLIYALYQKGGGIIDLEPCLTHSSTMEPTLAPVAVERTMTTRAAASVIAS